MSMVMFQFRHAGGTPTLDDVCATYDLRRDQVDAEYGAVQTDSEEGLYVVLVDDSAQPQIDARLKSLQHTSDPAVGVFSNPRVQPFGSPGEPDTTK